jgi:tRNA (guanine37-N1)-methyltransferase
MSLRFDLITVFPEIFRAVSDFGVIGRAISRGLAEIHPHQLRDFAADAYKTIDDRPYGGGPGMVMMPGPLTEAVAHARRAQLEATGASGPVVLFSPAGRRMDQALLDRVAAGPAWIFVCGRYEGVDQRFIDRQVDELWSLGDFVLSGGEIPAMAVIDGAVRRLPGALGDAQSAEQDSFATGLLDCPHYTRPEVFQAQAVPEVLLSGHHERIEGFRRQAALSQTLTHRPDLIDRARALGQLTPKDEALLKDLGRTSQAEPDQPS